MDIYLDFPPHYALNSELPKNNSYWELFELPTIRNGAKSSYEEGLRVKKIS